mgnify:CR=1 FL=1
MKNKLAVIGGDLRIAKLAIMLANDGNEVYVYGLEKSEEIRRQKNIIQCDTIRKAIDDVEIVIGPIPFSSNGKDISSPFSEKTISIRELMHTINAKILIAGSITPDVYELANDEYIEIVDIMKKKGYSRFNVWWFNQIWKNELGIKKESTEYGCPLKYGHFGWYESIIPLIEDYCKKNTGRLK